MLGGALSLGAQQPSRTPRAAAQLLRFLHQGNHARPRDGGARAVGCAVVRGQPLDLLLVESAGHRVAGAAACVSRARSGGSGARIADRCADGQRGSARGGGGSVRRQHHAHRRVERRHLRRDVCAPARFGGSRTPSRRKPIRTSIGMRSTSSSCATTTRSPSISPPARRRSSRTFAWVPSRRKTRSPQAQRACLEAQQRELLGAVRDEIHLGLAREAREGAARLARSSNAVAPQG